MAQTAQERLTDFLQNVAVMSIDQLAKQYLIIAETGAEDETREGRAYYVRLLELLDAIGELRWPDTWRETRLAA